MYSKETPNSSLLSLMRTLALTMVHKSDIAELVEKRGAVTRIVEIAHQS